MPAGTGKRKAAGAGAATAQPASGGPPLFADCHVVFWANQHIQLMQQRMRQLGATLEPAVAAGSSTHVICPPAMTAQQAADKLDGFTG